MQISPTIDAETGETAIELLDRLATLPPVHVAPMRPERLIGLVMDRLSWLAYPERGEPSPLAAGGTAAQWAALAGLNAEPCKLLTDRRLKPLLLADGYQPEALAAEALRTLASMDLIERVGQDEPPQYRPLRGGKPWRSKNWLRW